MDMTHVYINHITRKTSYVSHTHVSYCMSSDVDVMIVSRLGRWSLTVRSVPCRLPRAQPKSLQEVSEVLADLQRHCRPAGLVDCCRPWLAACFVDSCRPFFSVLVGRCVCVCVCDGGNSRERAFCVFCAIWHVHVSM